MGGIFMNSMGLGDLTKYLNIADDIRYHHMDFVTISKNR